MDKYTDEQLVELNQQLGRQQDEIRLQRAEIVAELRRRAAARALAAAGLSADVIVQGQVLEAKAGL